MATEAPLDEREPLEGLVGSVVADKYRVDRLIGRGGMGAVFQATNLGIGKRVALKFLNRSAAEDRDAAERFQREAMAASVVESAHIVHIFDSGTSEQGLPFLVMELLSGEDLRSRLKREGRLPVTDAVDVASQVLRALKRAHAAGLVHRDLKPDNVFLCQRDDGALFVKIVDFGISKLARASTLDTLTRRGTVLGTAYYMSPEQAQAYADIDGRTDLFSVGAILYESLTGQPPHVAPTYEAVLIAICTKDPEDVCARAPDVPAELGRAIHRALARDRDQRFQSAEAFLSALGAAVPSAFSSGTRSFTPANVRELPAADGAPAFTSTSRTPSALRRRKTSTFVLSLIAVLAGFGVTALWMSRRAPVPSAEPLASSQSIEAATHAAALVPPAPASTLPPEASAAPSGASAAPKPSNSARVSRKPTPSSAKRPPRERPGKPGVASSLELSTREP